MVARSVFESPRVLALRYLALQLGRELHRNRLLGAPRRALRQLLFHLYGRRQSLQRMVHTKVQLLKSQLAVPRLFSDWQQKELKLF